MNEGFPTFEIPQFHRIFLEAGVAKAGEFWHLGKDHTKVKSENRVLQVMSLWEDKISA